MNREEILEKLKEIFVDILYIDPELDGFSESSNISDDFGMDSLDNFDLIMRIESDFNISIPDSDVETIKTIGECVNYLEKRCC